MTEGNQTVTILLEQFNHMCDELLELREYKKNSINMIDKIRSEIAKEVINYSGTGEEVIQAYADGLKKGLDIIDKYKAESEE